MELTPVPRHSAGTDNGRVRRPVSRLIAATGGALALAAASMVAQPASAELAGVGPVDAGGHGYPIWYEDANDLRLDLCLDGPPMCLEGLVDPTQPATVANMPDESFWWQAEAAMALPTGGDALLVLAQEAAWLNEVPEAGQNMSFARVRIRVTGLQVGGTYTVTYPFGQRTFTAEDAVRNINFTDDVGCASAPCDVTLALTGEVGPFLTWSAAAPAPPAGFIGDPTVEHTITGSPTGNNLFRVEGPGLGAGGVETDLFALQGKLATGAQPTPDLLTGSDSGRSDFDNVTRTTTPRFGGFIDPDRAGETVEILVDGAVAGSAAANGTSYELSTSALTAGTHRVRARIAGTNVTSNALVLRIDNARPTVSKPRVRPRRFNLDRTRFARITYRVGEAADVRASVRKGRRVVKTFRMRRLRAAGNVLQTWNGTSDRNRLVRAGRYSFRTVVTDVAGNHSVARSRIRVIR